MLRLAQMCTRLAAHLWLLPVVSLPFLPFGPVDGKAQDDPAQAIILERIEQLQTVGELTIRDQWVAARHAVTGLYENRDYTRAWTDTHALEELHRAILDMRLDGLDPEDYHLTTLTELFRELEASRNPDPELLADFDMLATDALARLIYHSELGKVDPESLDSHWNLIRQLEGIEPGSYVQQIIDSGELYERVASHKPQHQFYTGLKQALAEYREIEAAGGWPIFPNGPSIEAGSSDPRIPALREQLTMMGDYTGPKSQSTLYDERLVEAVKLFQFRHGLPTTGLVGSMTMAGLSVPVEKRIEQIRVSLERGRWVLQDLESRFLVVNIAAFKVYLMRDGKVEWETRAQVGRTYRKTPVFKSELRYMDVNPTWTVPRTILEKDMLPRIKQDPSYLQQKGLKLLDRNGDEADPATVEWSRYSTAAGFPYLLRQGPGPSNALGRIKFMFPNDYAIFLHDTPSRNLFEQSERAFSSGCVRVEGPFKLAEFLMDDPETWPEERFLEIKDSGETTSVFLPKEKRIPVLLLYWTADAGVDGYLHFRDDIYERDAAILAGLDGDFTLRARPVVAPPSQ
jgi:murein L,D-transpeptidase YcbB/YkuD